MESIENSFEVDDNTKQKSKSKRKWREIEALKDKHRLKRELEEIDHSFNYETDDLF